MHAAVLLVGQLEDADAAYFGEHRPNPAEMRARIVFRRTWPSVDGKLHHHEPIPQQVSSKLGRLLPASLGRYREIEQYDKPHCSIAAYKHGDSLLLLFLVVLVGF